MKDLHRRTKYKIMPKMFRESCPCCNWTLIGNKRKNRRIVNKQIRAKIKQELINE